MDTEKLEEMFRVKYESLVARAAGDVYEDWIGYCDKHKILLLHPEWLADTLNEGLKGRVCIHTPEEGRDASPWLLVPRKFAERAMILGFLP